MKFSCTQEKLNKALSLVAHVASKNANLPILQNVLVSANEEGITLLTTNLELAVRIRIRGKVEESGMLTVPAQVFANYVSLVTADTVSVVADELTLHVSAAGQNTKIKGQNANDFPLIPEVDVQTPIRVMTTDLQQALSQTVFATAKDESRPELTGVFVQVKGNQMIFASTDSYRLAERHIPCKRESDDFVSTIIPSQALQEVLRALGNESEETEIIIQENQALFTAGEAEVIVSRLIDGRFPDYKQIIPTEERTTIIVRKDEFIKAIKASSLFSRSGIHDINIHVSPETQSLTLTTVNNQLGENVTKVQAEITGDSNSIIFNFRYLLDGLTQIASDQVSITLVDNNMPGVFRPAGGAAEQQHLYIIMPIKQ